MSSLPVLEARNRGPSGHAPSKGPWEDPFLPLLASGDPRRSLACSRVPPGSASAITQPCLVSLSLLLMTPVIGFRAHSKSGYFHPKILTELRVQIRSLAAVLGRHDFGTVTTESTKPLIAPLRLLTSLQAASQSVRHRCMAYTAGQSHVECQAPISTVFLFPGIFAFQALAVLAVLNSLSFFHPA